MAPRPGFGAYRRSERVADVATSQIGALAVGQVRVSGTVEPAEVRLVSALQSRDCVYYRSRVREAEGRSRRTVLGEERAVGFRVRDASGTIRVFPRGAAWDVPAGFSESDGIAGDSPPGLAMRDGPAIVEGGEDRDARIARLLSVRPPGAEPEAPHALLDPLATLGAGGRRDYEEARIEPGDVVTVVGTALPFDQLPDPAGDDLAGDVAAGGPLAATADPEIAADLDAARAAGTLASDPEDAWGNAAIPGFGIGRPVRAPELDPAAAKPVVASAATAERFERTFDIGPSELVLAAAPGRPLLISAGAPTAVVARDQELFIQGLLGAVVAIGSAVVLALQLGGGLVR